MILEKLYFKNFRVFKNRCFDFSKGIIGIIGSNGKGKSRIVEGISFLCTGDIEGTKEEAITVGEVTGYVSGKFTHEGKEVYLERHLDTSKVILKYAGKEYKKSSEVKEFWDKLLNINSEIFNNIIIARQGEIPKLFLGSKAERTSIFQKIFLVPNTEKLRDIIWKDYIKTLPPPFPVDDVQAIEAELLIKNESLVLQKIKSADYTLVTLDGYRVLENQIRDIQFTLANIVKQEEINLKLTQLLNKLNSEQKIKEGFEAELKNAPFSLSQLSEQLAKFEECKIRMESRNALSNQSADVEKRLKEFDINNINENINALRIQIEALHTTINLAEKNIVEANAKLRKYSSLTDKAVCPTCGQDIHVIANLIKILREELAGYQDVVLRSNIDLTLQRDKITPYLKHKETYDKLSNNYQFIQTELLKYTHVEYDESSHQLYIAAYSKLDKLSKDINIFVHNIMLIEQDIKASEALRNSLNTEFTSLGKEELHKLLQQASYDASVYKVKILEKQEIDKAVSVLNAEISNLNQRIVNSETNIKRNQQRNILEKSLLALYDAFHANQFAKKVIQKYSYVVTDYLLQNLVKFNIPYTANVNDDFGIDVINVEGHRLPIVSGGQAMIIGLCLRLALLQLFAQNFSFIIIDEGSTGLHKINQEIYFDMIRQFPRNQFEQVFIIDHSEKLADVVDHVIDLDKEYE